jgi:hypothetical protein
MMMTTTTTTTTTTTPNNTKQQQQQATFIRVVMTHGVDEQRLRALPTQPMRTAAGSDYARPATYHTILACLW